MSTTRSVTAPVLVLGCVAPYAVRLSVAALDEAGRVAGRLYAISTLGSLAGTFLSALVLIPFVGTRRTFLTYALVLGKRAHEAGATGDVAARDAGDAAPVAG